MTFNLPSIKSIFSRYKNGDSYYFVTDAENWGDLGGNNLEVAENHPILTPALLFISKIFSQANFYVLDTKKNVKIFDHEYVRILKRPNYFQTKTDFLETLCFTHIGAGHAVAWLRKDKYLGDSSSIYLLNPYLIEYPKDFTTKMTLSQSPALTKKKIIYDRNGENKHIPINELMFFYDMPNALSENGFKSKSRIDGLKQTLINTKDSLKAKNIILKTNGKELITGKIGGVQMSPDEKENAQMVLNQHYGLGHGRSRVLITKSEIVHKSLHIPLRDLGLDESVKVDGNLIYTNLHIPKDILSLEAKKTTYNNFKESMVSYIQNEMQSTLNSICDVFNKFYKDDRYELRGDFDSLPIMKHILIEKYDGIIKKATALRTLRMAGIPDEIALEECGYDTNIKLNEITHEIQNNTQQQNQGEDKKGAETEVKESSKE